MDRPKVRLWNVILDRLKLRLWNVILDCPKLRLVTAILDRPKLRLITVGPSLMKLYATLPSILTLVTWVPQSKLERHFATQTLCHPNFKPLHTNQDILTPRHFATKIFCHSSHFDTQTFCTIYPNSSDLGTAPECWEHFLSDKSVPSVKKYVKFVIDSECL